MGHFVEMKCISLGGTFKMKLGPLLPPPDILDVEIATHRGPGGNTAHDGETGVVDGGAVALLRIGRVNGDEKDDEYAKTTSQAEKDSWMFLV
jgi:hypothetical protein